MITGRLVLAVAAAVSWAITLVITAPTDVDAWHRILVGVSSSLMAAAFVAYVTEARRVRLVSDLQEQLRMCLAMDEVLKMGIRIGNDEWRKTHVQPPVLMKDFRAAKHCGPDCAECRGRANAQ
jgi:hypothetical protein